MIKINLNSTIKNTYIKINSASQIKNVREIIHFLYIIYNLHISTLLKILLKDVTYFF